MKIFFIVLLVLIVLILLWYTISFRAVNKQKVDMIKEHSKVKVGSNIVLANGIHGQVQKLEDTTANIIIDKSKNVVIKVERVTIAKVLG